MKEIYRFSIFLQYLIYLYTSIMISPFKKEVFSFGILYIVYIFAVRLFLYGHTHIERKI